MMTPPCPPPVPWLELLVCGPRDASDVSALCDLLSPGRDLGRRLRRDDPGDRRAVAAVAALAAEFLCAGCHLVGADARAAVEETAEAIIEFVVNQARRGAAELPKVGRRIFLPLPRSDIIL